MTVPLPSTAGVSWKRELGLAALLALVPVAVAVAFVLCGGSRFCLVEDDGFDQYQPLLTEDIRRVLSGELPLWSPYSGCGFPLYARSAALYPVHYLAHGICRAFGLKWQEIAVSHVLHLGAAAAAAFLYLRYLRVGRWPASVGALGYSLGGPLLGIATNWNEIAVMAPYVPLGFLVVEHLVAGSQSWFWPCCGGLLGALAYMCLGPLGIFKYGLLLLLYFLAQCRAATFGLALRRLVVAGLLAFLGCSGQLLATWEMMGMTTRITDEGISVAQGLNALACPPEFYRGFVYPLVEFDWPRTYEWCSKFNGSTLFVGPLAILGLCLALAHFRTAGPHRALAVLLGIYFVLSLGSYFDGNVILQALPLFKQHRWPVRWTFEFCFVAALLTGVGLQLGWDHVKERPTRWALATYVGIVFVALTTRTSESTAWELNWKFLILPWLLLTMLLAYYFNARRPLAFHLLALVITLTTLVVNVPGAQRHRFGHMRELVQHPLELNRDSAERVLHLSPRKDQLEAGGEGNYAYCLPNQFELRSVTTYGPWKLRIQAWQAGLNGQAEVMDADAAADAFLQGHLLETLRVSHVVVPRDHEVLNAACRSNPHLRWLRDTEWKSIYAHEGFREPAFFVQEVQPETELTDWAKLGHEQLSRLCYVESAYDGPTVFQASGSIEGFQEANETIGLRVDTPAPQLLVVTTTWYPGWEAFVDGQRVPLYRVNGSFMGVPVPAGAHEVRLRFWPVRIVLLIGLNVLVLLLLLGYCAAHVTARL